MGNKVTIFINDGSICGEMEATYVKHSDNTHITHHDLQKLLNEWSAMQKKKCKKSHAEKKEKSQ